uniref:Uncharacterized protein n=1 Tax=uncultured marine virus TaxID=186617 RepID=A0A0F7L667_9VIRU|nr:hypothetical protein [uncultured marine virus]
MKCECNTPRCSVCTDPKSYEFDSLIKLWKQFSMETRESRKALDGNYFNPQFNDFVLWLDGDFEYKTDDFEDEILAEKDPDVSTTATSATYTRSPCFPDRTRRRKKPKGWSDLGLADQYRRSFTGGEIHQRHDLCGSLLHIGKELDEVFKFCPLCDCKTDL